MIDTHAHLTSPSFSADLPCILSRARQAGLSSIICVSESLADAHAVLSLTASHRDLLHPALGLHPSHVTALPPASLSASLIAITTLLRTPTTSAVAIGEVGLDHTPHVLASAPSPISTAAAKRAQADTFAHFLALSSELALPVSAHSRGAGRHALALVEAAARRAPVAVCMHAFDGRAVYAERALQSVQEGLYFSVPPSVVRDPQMEKLVRRLPLQRMVLESDAPALAPQKGERNEPARLAVAVEAIAVVKGLAEGVVREALMENALRLFPRIRTGSLT